MAWNAYEQEDDLRRYDELIARNQWSKLSNSPVRKASGRILERQAKQEYIEQATESVTDRAKVEFLALLINMGHMKG